MKKKQIVLQKPQIISLFIYKYDKCCIAKQVRRTESQVFSR